MLDYLKGVATPLTPEEVASSVPESASLDYLKGVATPVEVPEMEPSRMSVDVPPQEYGVIKEAGRMLKRGTIQGAAGVYGTAAMYPQGIAEMAGKPFKEATPLSQPGMLGSEDDFNTLYQYWGSLTHEEVNKYQQDPGLLKQTADKIREKTGLPPREAYPGEEFQPPLTLSRSLIPEEIKYAQTHPEFAAARSQQVGQLSESMKLGAQAEEITQSPSVAQGTFGEKLLKPKWWVSNFTLMAPQAGAQIAAGLASRGSSIPAVAAYIATGAIPEAGNAYKDAIKRGANQESATSEGLMVGVATAALDYLPGEKILFKNPTTREFFTQTVAKRAIIKAQQVGVAGLAEGTAEAGQEVAADVARYVAENDPESFKDWQERYATSGILGAAMGGAAKVAVSPIAEAKKKYYEKLDIADAKRFWEEKPEAAKRLISKLDSGENISRKDADETGIKYLSSVSERNDFVGLLKTIDNQRQAAIERDRRAAQMQAIMGMRTAPYSAEIPKAEGEAKTEAPAPPTITRYNKQIRPPGMPNIPEPPDGAVGAPDVPGPQYAPGGEVSETAGTQQGLLGEGGEQAPATVSFPFADKNYNLQFENDVDRIAAEVSKSPNSKANSRNIELIQSKTKLPYSEVKRRVKQLAEKIKEQLAGSGDNLSQTIKHDPAFWRKDVAVGDIVYNQHGEKLKINNIDKNKDFTAVTFDVLNNDGSVQSTQSLGLKTFIERTSIGPPKNPIPKEKPPATATRPAEKPQPEKKPDPVPGDVWQDAKGNKVEITHVSDKIVKFKREDGSVGVVSTFDSVNDFKKFYSKVEKTEPVVEKSAVQKLKDYIRSKTIRTRINEKGKVVKEKVDYPFENDTTYQKLKEAAEEEEKLREKKFQEEYKREQGKRGAEEKKNIAERRRAAQEDDSGQVTVDKIIFTPVNKLPLPLSRVIKNAALDAAQDTVNFSEETQALLTEIGNGDDSGTAKEDLKEKIVSWLVYGRDKSTKKYRLPAINASGTLRLFLKTDNAERSDLITSALEAIRKNEYERDVLANEIFRDVELFAKPLVEGDFENTPPVFQSRDMLEQEAVRRINDLADYFGIEADTSFEFGANVKPEGEAAPATTEAAPAVEQPAEGKRLGKKKPEPSESTQVEATKEVTTTVAEEGVSPKEGVFRDTGEAKPSEPTPARKTIDVTKMGEGDVFSYLMGKEGKKSVIETTAKPTKKKIGKKEPTPKKKLSTKEKADLAVKELNDLFKEINDYLKTAPQMVFGPNKSFEFAARLVAAGVKVGYYKFKNFIENVAANIGREATIALGPDLVKHWDNLRAHDSSGVLSESEDVAGLLPEIKTVEDDLKEIEEEAKSISEGIRALKERSMTYQPDLKEEVAKANGLPENSYFDLPYKDWEKIRDEYFAKQKRPTQPTEPSLAAERAVEELTGRREAKKTLKQLEEPATPRPAKKPKVEKKPQEEKQGAQEPPKEPPSAPPKAEQPGEPERPGQNPKVNRPIAAISAAARQFQRNMNALYDDLKTVHSDTDREIKAIKALEEDYDGLREKIRTAHENGILLRDFEQRAAMYILDNESNQALETNDLAKIADTINLSLGYLMQKGDIGRAMRSMADIVETPEQRIRRSLRESLTIPNPKLMSRIAAAYDFMNMKVTENDISKMFPGSKNRKIGDKEFEVTTKNGKKFKLKFVDKIDIDWQQAEKQAGANLSQDERKTLQSLSRMTFDETSGLHVIELVEGAATHVDFRHELLHFAREKDMINEDEWNALVKKYAPDVKGEVEQEEAIAKAVGEWVRDGGIFSNIRLAFNRMLSAMGLTELDPEIVNRLMQSEKLWARKGGERGGKETKYSMRKKGSPTQKVQDLITEAAKESAKIKKEIAKLGLDYDSLKDIHDKPVEASRALGIIATHKSNLTANLVEYWINSILSGPATHLTNFASGALFGAMDYGVYKPLEILWNTATGNKDGYRISDYKHFMAGVMPGVLQGVANAKIAFKSEVPPLGVKFGRGKYEKVQQPNISIKGKIGRFIRAPQRALMAADQFMKSVIAEVEVGAHAHRIARNEGKTGVEYENRVKELHKDLNSAAWQAALDHADFLTLNQEGGKVSKTAKDMLIKMRTAAPPLGFLLPFINITVNTAETGYKLSPLGTLDLAYRIYEGVKTGDWKAANKQLAHQTALAIGGMLLLMTNDEDDPWMTGAESSAGARGREFSKRTFPSMSINPGKFFNQMTGSKIMPEEWFSYKRLQPMSVAGAMTVDFINSYKSGSLSRMAKTPMTNALGIISNTPFVSGISDLLDAVKDAGEGEQQEALARWVARWASSFYPNLLKQAGKAIRANPDPERRVWGDGVDWIKSLGKRTIQNLELGVFEDQPEYDIYGRTHGENRSRLERFVSPVWTEDERVTPADRMYIQWNTDNPDDKKMGPQRPQRFYTQDGEKKWMNDEQYAYLSKLEGKAVEVVTNGYRPKGNSPTAGEMDALTEDIRSARSIAKDLIMDEWSGKKPKGYAEENLDKKLKQFLIKRKSAPPPVRRPSEYGPADSSGYKKFMARKDEYEIKKEATKKSLKRLEEGK